jgi:hypothetical protein
MIDGGRNHGVVEGPNDRTVWLVNVASDID